MQQWYVYLLCCADNTLYCGITTNIQRRLKEHNGEKKGGAKYTKHRRPVHLCAFTESLDRSQALKIENYIRSLPKHKKINALKTICQLKKG